MPDRPDWDPYAPHEYNNMLHLVSSDPSAQGLVVHDDVLNPNQLYFQSNGLLITRGTVNLGEAYTLWIHVDNWGPFGLYDNGKAIISQRFLTPGWYKMDCYAEILKAHTYYFNATGWSNNVIVIVNSGSYSTTYSLVGKVVDQYGYGIPRANVKISGSNGGRFSTSTNTQGYYGMDVPSGVYTVIAELEGYRFTQATARVWMGTVSVAGNIIGYPHYWGYKSSDFYQETQQNVGQLEGKVTDRNNIGISGVLVNVDGLFVVSTDNQGNYLVNLSSGWHTISIGNSDYIFQPASVDVQIRSDQVTRLDFKGRKMLVLGSR
ncbi:MAG: carboxypeptidase-like regulatory domain-containing protein [Methanotrichaceae archaeon]